MTAASASAPGKSILFGEHAVVYDVSAIAMPLRDLRVTASVTEQLSTDALVVLSGNLPPLRLVQLFPDEAEPLLFMVQLVLRALALPLRPLVVRVASDLPIASGLGSGAAVSTALGRAIAAAYDVSIADDTLNALVYEVEKRHHGTPSGIDNTVIVYDRLLRFQRTQEMKFLQVGEPLHFLIANTGVAALTRDAVSDVRRLVEGKPSFTQRIFSEIAAIVSEAEAALTAGSAQVLGALMTANHALLQSLTVSSPLLDALVREALEAGAWGAKLTGGGRGGNMLALASPDELARVQAALYQAGAASVHTTVLS